MPAPQRRRRAGPHLPLTPGRDHDRPRLERGQRICRTRCRTCRPPDRPQCQKGPLAEGRLLARRALRQRKVADNTEGAIPLAPSVLVSATCPLGRFLDVGARGVIYGRVLVATQRWGIDLLPGALREPPRPVVPPSPLVLLGVLEPLIGGLVLSAAIADPVTSSLVRWADHAGDVPAASEGVTDVSVG